jgi:hypothetical protein
LNFDNLEVRGRREGARFLAEHGRRRPPARCGAVLI